LADAKMMTFDQCAEAYILAHKAGWKNAKHGDQWTNTLNTYASPIFGHLPVAAIDTGLVVKCLAPIWESKTETAGRVRGRIESVLAWATTSGYRIGENCVFRPMLPVIPVCLLPGIPAQCCHPLGAQRRGSWIMG